MRSSLSILLLLVGVSAAILASGCQSQPKATPEPTPTENVVVEVVTATTPPTLAPTETLEATITPLATFTPIGLESPTPTPQASPTLPPTKIPVANTPKAAKSATPAAPTAAPLKNKYPAPGAISPSVGDLARDGSDIKFFFSSVGPLGANECYLLYVEMVNANGSMPPAGDDFLDKAHCGDQTPANKPLTFILFRGKYTGSQNYGTIEAMAEGPGGADLLKVHWYVRVVQNSGSDGIHHNVTFLSPPSATLEFDFQP